MLKLLYLFIFQLIPAGTCHFLKRFTLGLTGNGYVPPLPHYALHIVDVITFLMEKKMCVLITSAQAYYKGLKFIGLTADCWTSRSLHGYVTIEATFIYFDLATNKFVFYRLTLGCIYMSGSHDGPSIAALIKKIFGKFGIIEINVRMYVSDSGGGIPAAAAHLGIPRDACCLHSLDTAVGHALGVKGRHPSPAATRVNGLLKAVMAQANVFKNATQKREEYHKTASVFKAAEMQINPEAAAKLPRSQIVQLPGNTRMWSAATTFTHTAEQDLFLDSFFAKHDPLNASRLTPTQRHEVAHIAPLLQTIAGIQRNMEAGEHVTSSSKWLVPQDLISFIRGSGNPPMLRMLKGGTMTDISIADLPSLAADLRTGLQEILPRYSPPVPTDEQLASAYLDPRCKNHPLINTELSARARDIVMKRLVHKMLQSGHLKDDAVPNPAITAPVNEAPTSLLSFDIAAMAGTARPITGMIESGIFVDLVPPLQEAAPRRLKEEKANFLATRVLDEWNSTPSVARPLLPAASFAYLSWLNSFTQAKKHKYSLQPDMQFAFDCFQAVQGSAQGWPATAAGVERIASRAGQVVSALRNRYQTGTVEKMVFFLMNRSFRPTVDEVVVEIQRRREGKKAMMKQTRAASKLKRTVAAAAVDAAPSAAAAALPPGALDPLMFYISSLINPSFF